MISKASLTPYHHQSLDEDINNSAILRTFLESEKITHTCWHVYIWNIIVIIILHRASALIVHFGGGPRARGEDRNSIAPTFLQYARDLVFVSFGFDENPDSKSLLDNC